MKKFKILGIIAILVIAMDAVLYFVGNWNDISTGYMEGWESARNVQSMGVPSQWDWVTLEAYADESIPLDSLTNTQMQTQVPYKVTQIHTQIKAPLWRAFFLIGLAFILPALVCGFVCLARLLIAVARKDVFHDRNIWRIRCFAYSLFAYHLWGTAYEWCMGHYALAQTSLPGYELASNSSFSGEWTMVMTIVLFTEIFAAAVRIKEEQDLTI